jgi:dolichol-phosphate mannosyltransferase
MESSQSVSIIIPSLNERENIPIVVERLEALLAGRKWEAVFVDDDSRDGSLEVLMNLARTKSNVRFIRRIGRRGLASACLEGMASSAADVFAVMDCDLQHDETILPKMLTAFEEDPDLELAVGTRYAGEGGGVGNWSRARVFISRFATNLGSLARKTELSDPMSGFFAIRREVFEQTVRQMTGKGFKILLDMVLSAGRPLKTREFSYEFRTRQHGESKLDTAVVWEYLMLLLDKMVGHIVPIRFLMFMIVGGAGVFVHMAILTVIYELTPKLTSIDAQTAFTVGQSAAAVIAMTFNFFVNNFLTYRDKRLKGMGMLFGLISFYMVCSVGAVANVGIASALFGQDYSWWLSAIAGILVGAVWNYGASSVVTWRKK